eukprot:TRINITY_DN5980_c0_g1_i1.p1 TRINITY_DN5980_c0_g1~~TRINITY_DN5980_c0_g1_i1.p1  ORF type:complete len:330 (+),score=67.61 TRINITY_DN5980_c0_g1_i1:101-991(+)
MVDLKKLLRQRSLPVSGKKAILIQRLAAYDQLQASVSSSTPTLKRNRVPEGRRAGPIHRGGGSGGGVTKRRRVATASSPMKAVASPPPLPVITDPISFWDRFKTSPPDHGDSDDQEDEEEVMEPAELMKFLAEIEVSPTSAAALVFCYYCDAQRPGYLYKSELLNAMERLNCNGLEALTQRVKLFETRDVKNMAQSVFMYTFDYLTPENSRVLPTADAVMGIQLILSGRRHVSDFLEFLRETDIKGINKDTWKMLFRFVSEIGTKPAFCGYSVDDAWPVVLDDFVEFVLSKDAEST